MQIIHPVLQIALKLADTVRKTFSDLKHQAPSTSVLQGRVISLPDGMRSQLFPSQPVSISVDFRQQLRVRKRKQRAIELGHRGLLSGRCANLASRNDSGAAGTNVSRTAV